MDEIFEKAIAETMTWVVDTILIPHFMSLGLNATGEWVANVGTRVEKNKGIISGRKYTEQLVWGRKPMNEGNATHEEKAKWAAGMANYNPKFEQWLRARGLTEYGFQVAYKIADVGTEIYKNGGTDLLEILEAPETIDKINAHLGQQLSVNVQLFLEREIVKAW